MGLLSPLADCDAAAVGDTRGLSKGGTFMRDWDGVFISKVILGLVSRGDDGPSGVEKVKLPCRIISRTSSGVNFGLESSNDSSTSSEWGLMGLLVRRRDDEGLFDDRVRRFDDTGLFDNRDRLVSRSRLPEGE